jgi:hypothetical protein
MIGAETLGELRCLACPIFTAGCEHTVKPVRDSVRSSGTDRATDRQIVFAVLDKICPIGRLINPTSEPRLRWAPCLTWIAAPVPDA